MGTVEIFRYEGHTKNAGLGLFSVVPSHLSLALLNFGALLSLSCHTSFQSPCPGVDSSIV